MNEMNKYTEKLFKDIKHIDKKEIFSLNKTAKEAGGKNFDKFHNSGYKGLYNGETVNDIAKRKGLRNIRNQIIQYNI